MSMKNKNKIMFDIRVGMRTVWHYWSHHSSGHSQSMRCPNTASEPSWRSPGMFSCAHEEDDSRYMVCVRRSTLLTLLIMIIIVLGRSNDGFAGHSNRLNTCFWRRRCLPLWSHINTKEEVSHRFHRVVGWSSMKLFQGRFKVCRDRCSFHSQLVST